MHNIKSMRFHAWNWPDMVGSICNTIQFSSWVEQMKINAMIHIEYALRVGLKKNSPKKIWSYMFNLESNTVCGCYTAWVHPSLVSPCPMPWDIYFWKCFCFLARIRGGHHWDTFFYGIYVRPCKMQQKMLCFFTLYLIRLRGKIQIFLWKPSDKVRTKNVSPKKRKFLLEMNPKNVNVVLKTLGVE